MMLRCLNNIMIELYIMCQRQFHLLRGLIESIKLRYKAGEGKEQKDKNNNS